MASLALAAPSTATSRARVLILAIAAVVLAQVWLVFVKSINWDEFLHHSQIHDLRGGRLFQAFQMLHTWIYIWVPALSDEVIRQIQFVRLANLGFELITLAALFGIARRFASVEASLLACLAYVGGGGVFLHGFAERPDPIATAFLMSALWIAATRRLDTAHALAAALLIGLAGVATIKSALYLPCFAGIAWWRMNEEGEHERTLRAVLLVALAAPVVFAVAIAIHAQWLNPDAPKVTQQPIRTIWTQFFTQGLFSRGRYIVQQMIFAPFLTVAIVLAPFAWKPAGLSKPARMALVGMMLPLLSLAVYRNTFPYFFVCLLAPVAVAVAPLFDAAMRRYDWRFIAALLLAAPAILTVREPRGELETQRAIGEQVSRLFPKGTPYLSYSGMSSDSPRVIWILTSGVGLANYYRTGDPIIARASNEGRLRYVIADHEVIEAALRGEPFAGVFLPADDAALRDNYAHFWGPLWLEGTELDGGATKGTIAISRGGKFTLGGGPALVDGQPIAPGETIRISAGSHVLESTSHSKPVLWRGTIIPRATLPEPVAPIYTNF